MKKLQLDYIKQNEYMQKNVTERNAKKAFSLAIGCSAIMLALMLIQIVTGKYIFGFITEILSAAGGFLISIFSSLSFQESVKQAEIITKSLEFIIFFNMVMYIITILIPFSILSKKAGISYSEGFKLNINTPKKFGLYIPFTIGTGFLLNIIVRILFGDLFDRFIEQEGTLPDSVLGIVLYFIMIAFLPAIFEEWAFRGVLLRSLLPYGKGFALITSSIIFGLMHINPPQAIFAISFGLLAGFIYIKTGSIWYGALIHLINNAFAVTGSFISVYKNQESAETVFFGLIVIALMVTAIIGVIYFPKKGFFRTRLMRYTAPPDKPKIAKKHLFELSLINVFTFLFVSLYVTILIVRFFI